MHDLYLPGGVRAEIRLTGEDTGGAFCLLVDEAPPGWELPPHRHAAESETIHVVAGTMWLSIEGDEERFEVTAGSTVHLPAGMLHAGGTLGDEPLERVVVFSPAGIESFFAAIGTEDPSQAVDLETVGRLALEHGWEFS